MPGCRDGGTAARHRILCHVPPLQDMLLGDGILINRMEDKKGTGRGCVCSTPRSEVPFPRACEASMGPTQQALFHVRNCLPENSLCSILPLDTMAPMDTAFREGRLGAARCASQPAGGIYHAYMLPYREDGWLYACQPYYIGKGATRLGVRAVTIPPLVYLVSRRPEMGGL